MSYMSQPIPQYPSYQFNVLLHRLPQCVILESKSGSSLKFLDSQGRNGDNSLTIEKIKGDLGTAMPGEIRREFAVPVIGIMGIIQLLSSRYLLVISEANTVGYIQGAPVYLVAKTLAIAIPRPAVINEEERKLEAKYLEMLASFLESSGFYFSFSYDLTHSSQRMTQLGIREVKHDTVDSRFYWNAYLCRELVKQNVSEWIIPLMDGFIKIQNCRLRNFFFDYVLISRRSCKRVGARYHTRGADQFGNVANFVETEQMLCWEGHVSSFVETRGSVPVLWTQPGKGLKPKPIVDDYRFSRTAFRRHFDEQLSFYSKQVCVSLVDQRGNEQDLSEAYEMHYYLLNSPDIRFIAFDFHKECGDTYDRLSVLLDISREDLLSFGYFFKLPDDKVVMQQRGVFRTNCVDCLDRTNVVQTLFARAMLVTQLINIGVLKEGETLELFPDFEMFFRTVWVENADIISKRYTGTGALKTEFTKTGKKSLKGNISDAVNSGKRYLLKNFKDSERQEMMDLFLGKYQLMSDSEFRQTYQTGNDVKVWPVLKCRDYEKDRTAVLELNGHNNTLVQYTPMKAHFKAYPIDNLKQIARLARYRGLTIVLNSTPGTKEVLFQNPLQRETFLQTAVALMRVAMHEHRIQNQPKTAPALPQKPLIDFDQIIASSNTAAQSGSVAHRSEPLAEPLHIATTSTRRAGTFAPIDPEKFADEFSLLKFEQASPAAQPEQQQQQQQQQQTQQQPQQSPKQPQFVPLPSYSGTSSQQNASPLVPQQSQQQYSTPPNQQYSLATPQNNSPQLQQYANQQYASQQYSTPPTQQYSTASQQYSPQVSQHYQQTPQQYQNQQQYSSPQQQQYQQYSTPSNSSGNLFSSYDPSQQQQYSPQPQGSSRMPPALPPKGGSSPSLNMPQHSVSMPVTALSTLQFQNRPSDLATDRAIQSERTYGSYGAVEVNTSGPLSDRTPKMAASTPGSLNYSYYQTSDAPVQPSPFMEVINIFIGSWNMSRVRNLLPLDSWIPKGRHIYVIGTQSCLYTPPQPFTSSCKMHWFLHVQQYLGPSYTPIVMADSETTNTIVLVRQDLLFHISNVSKTFAVIEENNKSVKRNLRDGLNALKVAFSGQKPGEEKKDRPEMKRVIGCSVIFWYRDTSMCFINCQRAELPAKLDEYEISTDFDHVFKFGAVNITSNKRHRWVDLFNDKDGSITWRALFDSGLSCIQPVLPEPQPQLYPPMGVSCKLETTVTDYLCLGVGFQIVLFNLRATELAAPSGTTNGLDLYLKIHGSFLNEESLTSLKRKVFEATWDEALYLNPIFLSAEYLARKHLVIELRTVGFQVEEELLGTAVLSLEKSFSAPEEFRVSLTNDEQPVGWIYGCVHTRIVPPQR